MDGDNEIRDGREFSCRVENLKTVVEILTSLSLNARKDQPCYIEATPNSLNFSITGRAKSSQARVSLDRSIFEDYDCEDPSVKLSLNLTTLLDCLQIFGSSSDNTIATMSYTNRDAIFKLSLEEMGVLTTCDILSLCTEDLDDLADCGLFGSFREHPEECQLLIKSEHLRDAMQELGDVSGASTVRVEMKRNPEGMILSTEGNLGICELEFPRSSDIFISYRCNREFMWTYSLSSTQLGMKAVSVAKETFLRINSEGVMCIQHQIETSRGQETFVDFLMVPEDTLNQEGAGD